MATVLLLLALTVPASGAEPITVRAAVETDRVFAGESFAYRVIVEGATPQVEPQLPALDAFEVAYEGGHDVSSRSISVINGRTTETVIEQYYFQYQLTALSPGRHTIPAATLTIDGQSYRTQPIAITVVQPTEHQDFKLRLELEKEQVYVGEPVRLQVTWYLRQNVRGFALSMPLAGVFEAGDISVPADAQQGLLSGEYVAVDFLGSEVLARRGQDTLNGEQFTTLTLEKVLIPQEMGQFRIGPAAVGLNVVTGRAPSRSIFDDFFSGSSLFRNSPFSREVTRKLVVPSNELNLEVLPLPEPRPPSFTGLVGAYSIETAAAPTEVNVGDPITLTIRIRGPEPLENIPAPALHTQRTLVEDFKVSDEPALPVVQDGSAVFTQTVRALNDRVGAIPPLDLSFFDVDRGHVPDGAECAYPAGRARHARSHRSGRRWWGQRCIRGHRGGDARGGHRPQLRGLWGADGSGRRAAGAAAPPGVAGRAAGTNGDLPRPRGRTGRAPAVRCRHRPQSASPGATRGVARATRHAQRRV